MSAAGKKRYVCAFVYIVMYVSLYTHMHILVYIYIYICICTYIHVYICIGIDNSWKGAREVKIATFRE